MVTVYGAEWCEDTQRSLRHLRRLRVQHAYEDVDRDPAALERAKALNHGERRTPTIDVEGTILVEPRNHELTTALEEHGAISADDADRRLRFRNVGDLERGLRMAGGALAVVAAARLKSGWKWPLFVWGGFEMVSGAVGSCPVYTLTGQTSFAGPGDHPREAERRAWLAPAI